MTHDSQIKRLLLLPTVVAGMVSVAWQLEGKKAWWVYPKEVVTELGPPSGQSSCCDTWSTSPRYPLPFAAPPAPLAQCWGAELDPGDFLFFRSSTPHFAYPLGPMLSAISHLGECDVQAGQRAHALYGSTQ